MPSAISHSGLAVGLALLVLMASFSVISCNLVLSAYLRTGRGSYGDLAAHLFGPGCSSAIKWIIIVLNVVSILF